MIVRIFRNKGIRLRQEEGRCFLDCYRCGETIVVTYSRWLEERPLAHCPVSITGIQWRLEVRHLWPDTDVSLRDKGVVWGGDRVYSDTHASPQRVPARRPRPEGE